MIRKPLPPPSIDLVVFPQSDTEYIHFEDAQNNPFNRHAEEFSPVNAWWLADAALLSYWDEAAARPIWSRAGLDFEFLYDEGVQCHIASTDGLVIVAFRGIQPEWHDLVDIAQLRHRPWEFGGAVHEGFLNAHRQFWPHVEARLKRLDPTHRTTWFTGHSFGAALATLSMDRWPGRALYTIGSPPVGNRRFATGFNARHAGSCFRYVNHHDIVVYVASWLKVLIGNYTHVKARKYIDEDGAISSGAPSIAEWLVLLRGRGMMRRIPKVPGAVPFVHWPGVLIDHTPRRYAVHIWNDYVQVKSKSTSTSPVAEFSRV
jgi:hypothetical protein